MQIYRLYTCHIKTETKKGKKRRSALLLETNPNAISDKGTLGETVWKKIQQETRRLPVMLVQNGDIVTFALYCTNSLQYESRCHQIQCSQDNGPGLRVNGVRRLGL